MVDGAKAGFKAALKKVWHYVKSYVVPAIGAVIGFGVGNSGLNFGPVIDKQMTAQPVFQDKDGKSFWQAGFGTWLTVGIEAPIAFGMLASKNWIAKGAGGFVGGLAIAGTKTGLTALGV